MKTQVSKAGAATISIEKKKGVKPKMILKRGSNKPVQLKHAHQPEATSDTVAGTVRKHKNSKVEGDDVTADTRVLDNENEASKKPQKGQKDKTKKKKKS